MLRRTIALGFLLAAAQLLAAAEDDLDARLRAMQAQFEKLNQKVEAQQQTIDEQKKKIEEQQRLLVSITTKTPVATVDDKIMQRLGRVEKHADEAILIASRKKPNDINPAIGAALDTSFGYFDGPHDHAVRPAGNDFAIRGAELLFSADVDPYFKTYMVLNATPDPANNDEAVPSLEEAAIMTTSLSHVQIKGGRFFMPFGRLSMIHDHDLPFTTRPPSIDNYVGGESQGDGIQVQALVPVDHFFQLTGGVFNKLGANFPVAIVDNHRSGTDSTYFAKALTSFDLGESHTFDWGISTAQVPDPEIRRNLVDMELTYHWHPTTSPLREKLVWGTELLHNELRSLQEIPPATLGAPPTFTRADKHGYGGYSYVEYFLDSNWSAGPRVDLFQNTDPNVDSRRNFEQTYAAFVSYKFSEFSRLRLEYDRHEYADGKIANEAYLQWTVFWGAHTHNFDMR